MNSTGRAIGALAILLACGSARADDAATTTANVPVEVGFTARADHADPFNTVTLDVIFQSPSGRTLRVPAFWAGGRAWKVRYASGEVGGHRFSTECSVATDAGLHGVEGRVEIAPYAGDNPLFRRGPIRVADDRRHLAYADGTPFFWLGDTWWMGLSHRLALYREGRIVREVASAEITAEEVMAVLTASAEVSQDAAPFRV